MEIKIQEPQKFVNSILLFEESGCELLRRGDEFFIITDKTEEYALKSLEAHNPPPPAEPTIEDKLASVGLSLDDLKAALGLGGN